MSCFTDRGYSLERIPVATNYDSVSIDAPFLARESVIKMATPVIHSAAMTANGQAQRFDNNTFNNQAGLDVWFEQQFDRVFALLHRV